MPQLAGTFARMAQAMPCGMFMMPTVMPAMTSAIKSFLTSQLRSQSVKGRYWFRTFFHLIFLPRQTLFRTSDKVAKLKRKKIQCGRQISVVRSAPTILLPRVRIPSTLSLLFHFKTKKSIWVCFWNEKWMKMNNKRPGLVHFNGFQCDIILPNLDNLTKFLRYLTII